MKTLVAGFAVLTLCSMLGACAHTGLGQAPMDTDLVNDGSPAAQQQLVNDYRVAYADLQLTRPEADPAKFGFDTLQARATSDQAHTYLASSEPAAQKLQTPGVAVARFVASETFDYSVMAGFAALGAAAAAASYMPALVRDSNSGNVTMNIGTLGWSMLGGALFGWIVSWPFLVLGNALVVPSAEGIAAPDYQAAVIAYNKDLEMRVKTLVRPSREEASATSAPRPSTDATTQAPTSAAAESW
jgi:hypothetical protein